MNKKRLLYWLIPLVCIIGAFLLSNILPMGNTVERREKLLDNAIPKGNNWTISKEIEIDNYTTFQDTIVADRETWYNFFIHEKGRR